MVSPHNPLKEQADLLDEQTRLRLTRLACAAVPGVFASDDIISFCASSRAFMPHFHLPLQSGSDDVLRLMHRHYDTALFAHRVERIRELMPDAFIGVDVIVGTRGEGGIPSRLNSPRSLLEAAIWRSP